MRRVWLIARREYLERIRTRGFLVTTIMIPLIMAGFIYGSSLVGSKSHAEATIAIVSPDPQLGLDLPTDLAQPPAPPPPAPRRTHPHPPPPPPPHPRRREHHSRHHEKDPRLRGHRRLPVDHTRRN